MTESIEPESKMTAKKWIRSIEKGEIDMSLHDSFKAAELLCVNYCQLIGNEFEKLGTREQAILMLESAARQLQVPTKTEIDFEGYNKRLRLFLLDCLKRIKAI